MKKIFKLAKLGKKLIAISENYEIVASRELENEPHTDAYAVLPPFDQLRPRLYTADEMKLALEYGYTRGLEGDFTEEQESQFYLDLDKKTSVKLPSAFELEKEIVEGPNIYWYGKYIY